MDIQLWLYFMRQPQIIPYEILALLLIVGLVLASLRCRFWKWKQQFIFNGLSLAISFALLCYFSRFSGWRYFGEGFGALIGTVAAIFVGLVSLIVRICHNIGSE